MEPAVHRPHDRALIARYCTGGQVAEQQSRQAPRPPRRARALDCYAGAGRLSVRDGASCAAEGGGGPWPCEAAIQQHPFSGSRSVAAGVVLPFLPSFSLAAARAHALYVVLQLVQPNTCGGP